MDAKRFKMIDEEFLLQSAQKHAEFFDLINRRVK